MLDDCANRTAPLAADPADAIARDLLAVSRLDSVPTLLDVLCEITGMGFAAVARVTDKSWTVCAVKDTISFGLQPGDQLDVETTLCRESRAAVAPIVIDHASLDFRYRDHPTPKIYGIQSFVTVPIVLADGRYFGNLCAMDPAPARVSDSKVLAMFTRFAALIAAQLDAEQGRERDRLALRDERLVSELREQFIAILGHDLRNPLHAISATSTLIGRKTNDPVVIGMATRITSSARRMSLLINDVLDFARGRLGGGIGVELDPDADLVNGIQAVIKEFQEAHPTRQLLASVELPNPVRCDLGRMQQVASNLIGNALMHGAADSPIRVSAHAYGGFLTLEVWNQGEPIPAESIDRVFEPFWRRATAQHREGLGLGLHICAQIIHAHGGRLTVSSSRAAGTTFTARMPVHAL